MRTRHPVRQLLRHLAAATALALTVALGGCGDAVAPPGEGDDPGAAPASTSPATTGPTDPVTEIPDGFPLTWGMASQERDDITVTHDPAIEGFTFCGTDPFADAEPVAVRSAILSGGEAYDARDLRLFATAREARRTAERIRDLAVGCPESETEGIARVHNDVRTSPFAPDPSLLLVQAFVGDDQPVNDHNVVQVVLVGNALLVTRTYVMGPATVVPGAIRWSSRSLRRTVRAMSLFDGGTAPSPDPTEDPGASASTTRPVIPEDFPLAVDMPEDGGDFTVRPPSPDGEGTGGITVCGQDVWPMGLAGGSARLTTDAQGPEWYDAREVYAFNDHEVTQNAMASLRGAESCGTFDNQVWNELDLDTGYDSVTFTLTHDDGLGSAAYQWTRVGSAIVLVMSYREGSAAGVADQARALVATSRRIAESMCIFSVAGC